MKSKIIVLAALSIISCGTPTKQSPLTKDELLKSEAQKIFATNIQYTEFRDKGRDSVIAGYYSFYPNNSLKYYRFFANMSTYVYSEEYDSNGKVTTIDGSPLVHNFVKLESDSLLIRLYLFSLNKKYKKIFVKTSDNRKIDLSLMEDSTYSNMKTTLFKYYNLKGELDIVSYVHVSFEDLLTRENKSFVDTISLHFKEK